MVGVLAETTAGEGKRECGWGVVSVKAWGAETCGCRLWGKGRLCTHRKVGGREGAIGQSASMGALAL